MRTKWPTPSSGLEPARPAAGRGSTSPGWVAPPHRLGLEPEHACRTASPCQGSRIIDHSGRHGPKPPKRSDRRRASTAAVGVLLGADRIAGSAASLSDRRGFIFCRRSAQLVEGARLAPDLVGGPVPVVEPGPHLAGMSLVPARGRRRRASCAGWAARRGSPGGCTRRGHGRRRAACTTLPPFEWPTNGDRPPRSTESSTTVRPGASASQLWRTGVLGVAVPRLVPAHDPPSGVGQLRGEHVVGPGEVKPAVGEQERRGRRPIAPLVAPPAGGRRSGRRPAGGGGRVTASAGEVH